MLIAWQGAVLAGLAFAAYAWALAAYGEGAHARMVALFALVSGQIGQTFNCRSRIRSAFSRLLSSPNIFLAVVAVMALQFAAVTFAPLAAVHDMPLPNSADLLICLICVVVPVVVTEMNKLVVRQPEKS